MRTVPVKPLPFEVKVPMVAIVVSFQFPGRAHRGLDGWRQTGGDRPAPREGPARSRGQPWLDFLVSREECRRSRAGEESRDRLLRGQERGGAKRRRPSVRHAKSRTPWASRMKCRWDTMADGSAHLNMPCDRSFTHDQPCLSPGLKSRVEREPTPRDVHDHKSIWEPEYEHQRHPTNLRSPTATPPAEPRALARIAAKGTQLWF